MKHTDAEIDEAARKFGQSADSLGQPGNSVNGGDGESDGS
jgi:hypothetical protein